MDRVVLRIIAFLLIGEGERLAGARIVDLDARPFAAAARRVPQLGGADASLFGQKLDAELFAARLENLVFGIGVLREQTRERRCRPERAVRVRSARKRAVGAAALLR